MSQAGIVISMAEVTLSSSAFYPLIRVLYPLISPSAIRPASVSVFYPNP